MALITWADEQPPETGMDQESMQTNAKWYRCLKNTLSKWEPFPGVPKGYDIHGFTQDLVAGDRIVILIPQRNCLTACLLQE